MILTASVKFLDTSKPKKQFVEVDHCSALARQFSRPSQNNSRTGNQPGIALLCRNLFSSATDLSVLLSFVSSKFSDVIFLSLMPLLTKEQEKHCQQQIQGPKKWIESLIFAETLPSNKNERCRHGLLNSIQRNSNIYFLNQIVSSICISSTWHLTQVHILSVKLLSLSVSLRLKQRVTLLSC